MEVIQTITALRETVKLKRKAIQQRNGHGTVGYVPTMGYLHQGHQSLMTAARTQCDIVVLSIFVNPLQFGPNEDFAKYPRDIERDLSMAEQAGVDIVFTPDVREMYPEWPQKTTVSVADATSGLCGASRPGHFDGVATIVLKLFNIVKPDKAFFGVKDAQQIAVIETMVRDMNADIEIVPCPTIREADGLAMSSRNVYLNEEQREQAVVLSQALKKIDDWSKEPNMTFGRLRESIRRHIESAPLAAIDYAEIVTYPSLQPIPDETAVDEFGHRYLAAVAVKFGTTRLIDNRIIQYADVL